MTPLEPLLRELVGEVLRRRRRAQGRTLADVSAQAGMSMQHLSDVERGRKDPSSEILAAICGALDMTIGQLLVLTGQAASVPSAPYRSEYGAAAAQRPVVLELTGGAHSRERSVGAHRAIAPSPFDSRMSAEMVPSARTVMLSAA